MCPRPSAFFISRIVALTLAGSGASNTALQAGEGPATFSAEQTAHGITIKYAGALVADYVVDQANKPYFWPVIGPSGKAVTRAFPMKDVEGEVKDHPHHRGIWFGHENIAGFDIWTDRGTWASTKKPGDAEAHLSRLGSVRHREFREVKAGAESAHFLAVDDIVGPDGKKALEDEERITFKMEGTTRIIDFNIDFIASEGDVVFGDAKDAGFNIRVANSIAVDSKQGGRIINSEGITDAAAWGKRASWVDYHGPLEGETVGVAMLNHPSSFRYPTPWHVRTYGLFTANPFGLHSLDKQAEDGTYTLKKGERLKLIHRLMLHTGDEKSAHIAEAFAKYQSETH